MARIALKLDSEGRLDFDEETRKKFGLTPNAEIFLEEGKNSLLIHRPISALKRIYVEPTNRCNLNCATCIRNVWDEPLDNMSWETYEKILAALDTVEPTPEIFFGGFGEPMSHPDILKMIRTAKEKGARVEIITNGTLLTEETIRTLIDLELNTLWVSIDGATPASYSDVRLGNMLPKILESVNRLRTLKYRWEKYWPELGISFVAMKRNIADLPEIVHLANNMWAKQLMVSNVLPYSAEMKDETLYRCNISSWRYKHNRVLFPRMDVNSQTKPGIDKLLTLHELHEIAGKEFLKPHDTCPFIEKGSISLRFDGKVSPCLPLLHSHVNYLEDRLRHVNETFFGDLSETALMSIWNRTDYMDFRHKVATFDFSPCTVCNSCELAESNAEDCVGSVPISCGGCLWGQGFVQCP